jgi:PAS domain S-box-containing protein
LRLAESIANQIAGAIANAQLYQREKRMEKELLKSEERFRLLVEMSPLLIWLHHEEKYIYLNPAAVRAFGASKPEELIGRSIFEVIHPDYWDMVRERIRILGTGEMTPPVEEKFVRLDKQVIDVEVTNAQAPFQDQSIILVVARDITEQRRAEKEKAVLQEQLQQAQKMEAIGTLAGGIAHDFNNILAAILGYAELAGFDIPEGSKARNNLQQLIKSAQRAKDLVQQILAFSRQGKQERKPLDIRPIVKEGLKFLRSSLPATIEIQQEVEEDLGVIESDPTQVYQVLMNLCTNAGHAMSEKGGVLEVSLNNVDLEGGKSFSLGLESGAYLRLRVRDTGHGMSPEVLKRIFDPYFTTKEVGKGTGLGLAVVHGIVKSCGGGIEVSSEVGKGSTFDIYFPRVEGVSSGSEVKTVEPLTLGGHERVLFVDDEQGIVEIGQKILEHLGYEVVSRTSSVEALELFRMNPDRFDVVITDMTMPNMTGDKMAQEMLRIRPGIPLILCTGFSENISQEKAQALGIREFVMKPLVMQDLANAIRRSLEPQKKGTKKKEYGQHSDHR